MCEQKLDKHITLHPLLPWHIQIIFGTVHEQQFLQKRANKASFCYGYKLCLSVREALGLFIYLKGQSHEIFDGQFFFIIQTSLGHWSMSFKISPSYSNFSVEKTDSPGYDTPGRFTCLGIIPRGVKFWRIFYWLARVWYHEESDFSFWT